MRSLLQLMVPALVASVLVAGGCVFREHDRYREARRAYEACVRDAAKSRESCETLRVERDARYEEYETRAQLGWGCENTPERCLPERGPGPK